ncbi:MAG: hypothetical protein EBX50_02620 [Chitinophagia bacterium]|nr:hypothetical protein [Chitinophagia bacterium]
MYKFITIYCLITLFATSLQAQTATGNSGSMIQLKDANGQIVLVGEENKTVNTWLLNKFSKGELCYIYEGLLYKVSKAVKKFSLREPSENGSEKIRQFENGFPTIDRNTDASFYELIYEGTKWIILKYWYMQSRERTEYGGTTEKTYITLSDYYLFNQSNNSLQLIGDRLSLKKITKSMPEFQSAITKWIEKNEAQPKTEADFIKLLSEIGG